MPSYTQYYGLAMFNQGEDWNSAQSIQSELERFVIIDKQLYGLYTIFGEGVIDGWDVSNPDFQDPGNISVSIALGTGIIDGVAAQTTFEGIIEQLPPDRTIYIMVRTSGTGIQDRSVEFYFNSYEIVEGSILLAKIVTSDDGIISIDNSVRTKIGFEALIDEAVSSHQHRGSPSKIDLAEETKGQLPGSKIADINASKITEGILPNSVIPSIDHQILADAGIYTHEQLDSLVENIDGKDDIVGTLTTVNLLKGLLYMKELYNDYDKDWVNSLAMIPGVSPDSFIDFDSTTSAVNLDSHCISGFPVSSGSPLTVIWNSFASFSAAYEKVNTVINLVGVTIERANLEELLVEGFESAGGEGGVISSFTSDLLPSNLGAEVTGDSVLKTEQGFGGRFTIDSGSVRAVFTKEFSVSQDWTNFEELLLDVRCGSLTHGQVTMYVVDELGGKSSVLNLLAENEVTISSEPDLNDFESRSFSITAFSRSQIKKIVIVADNVENNYIFHIDAIRLKRTQTYKDSATLRLRYSASEQVTFDSLNFASDNPTGTDVRVRLRVADTLESLSDALFGTFLDTGSILSTRGKHVEVDVTLLASEDKELAPTLTEVEIAMTAPSDQNGVEIITTEEWSRGKHFNVAISDDPASIISIETPLSVNRTTFINQNAIMEINEEHEAEFSITGETLPLSEKQSFDILFGTFRGGFASATGFVRTPDRRYFVADTDNDRIIIYNRDGKVVSIYAGAEQDADKESDFAIPVTATYNPDTGILYLGFTQVVTMNGEDMRNIVFQYGNKTFRLDQEGEKIESLNESLTGRVLEIEVSSDHRSLIANTADDMYVYYDTVIAPNFQDDFVGPTHRRPVYQSPIVYVKGLYKPVFAIEKLDGSGKLWIAQASILTQPEAEDEESDRPDRPTRPSGISSLLLLDPVTGESDVSDSVGFLEDWGGWIKELDDGRLIIAGGDLISRGAVYVSTSPEIPMILGSIYKGPDGGYPTSIDLDSTGRLWVSESSLADAAGRLIRMTPESGTITALITNRYRRINSVYVLENDDLLIAT